MNPLGKSWSGKVSISEALEFFGICQLSLRLRLVSNVVFKFL